MPKLSQRVCSVAIGDKNAPPSSPTQNFKLVTGLRTTFEIVKTLKKEPNTAQIKIYNLSEQSRSQMGTRGVPVILTAGYEDSSAVIFAGDSRTIDHIREGSEWITHIQCGDGESASLYNRIQSSFGPGSQVQDVISSVAKATGLNLGNLPAQLAKGVVRGFTQFTHGYTAHGKAVTELDKLMQTSGFEWSIQDGAIQVLRAGEAASGTADLWTPDTGLIGSPDHGNPNAKGQPSVLKAQALLRPHTKCGGLIQLRTSKLEGLFRVQRMEQKGDTHSQEWFTSVECLKA